MIPGNFEYHRPGTVDEAISLLRRFGDSGRLLAGGHSLIPMMKLRLADPAHLIDLQDVDGLSGITEADGTIQIGAMTTQAEIMGSELLATKCPILREAAELIADPQVRSCGTIGGNLANGDPGNDMPAVMMCLDAAYVLRGPDGERTVPSRNFYEDLFATVLAQDELLTGVRIPTPPSKQGYAYRKLKRKVGDYATAATAVTITLDGGSCKQASIALTNLGMTALYAEAAGQALIGTAVDDGAIDTAVIRATEITEPVSDLRGPAAFRTHAAGVITRRAIESARARAKGA